MNNFKVLEKLSPEKWTVVHGQCLSVGVGGFTLGGGVNMVGSTAKYGAAMEQVLSFEAFKLMLHPSPKSQNFSKIHNELFLNGYVSQ